MQQQQTPPPAPAEDAQAAAYQTILDALRGLSLRQHHRDRA